MDEMYAVEISSSSAHMFNMSQEFFQPEAVNTNDYLIRLRMHLFVTPVLLAVGFAGNLVSISIYAGKQLRKSSISVYVLAALVSDTIFLLTLCGPYVIVEGIPLMFQAGWCHAIICLSHTAAFLSVWNTVCMAVDSYITICHPTRMSDFCTEKRARMTVLSLTVATAALYGVVLPLTLDSSCYTVMNHFRLWPLLLVTDSVIALFLPSVAILILTVRIGYVIFTRLRHLEKVCQRQPLNGKKKQFMRPQIKVTKVLLVIAACTFALSFPNHVMRIRFLVQHLSDAVNLNGPAEHILIAVLQFFYHCNFCVKFLILLAFSENFRKTLLQRVFFLHSVVKKSWFVLKQKE